MTNWAQGNTLDYGQTIYKEIKIRGSIPEGDLSFPPGLNDI